MYVCMYVYVYVCILCYAMDCEYECIFANGNTPLRFITRFATTHEAHSDTHKRPTATTVCRHRNSHAPVGVLGAHELGGPQVEGQRRGGTHERLQEAELHTGQRLALAVAAKELAEKARWLLLLVPRGPAHDGAEAATFERLEARDPLHLRVPVRAPRLYMCVSAGCVLVADGVFGISCMTSV
jgi:hypothetical protein